MMQFPRLNLDGIKLGKPETVQKTVQKPKNIILTTVSALDSRKTVRKTGRKTKLLRIIRMARVKWKLFAIVAFSLVVILSMYLIQHKQSMLRKIQKVPCSNVNGMFMCKSKYSTGTMMLSTTPECKRYIYEINHVPFVNIPTWKRGTVSVAASKIMNIRDAKPACKLSMHRLTTPYKPVIRKGVTWITTKKHTQFTMIIKGTTILDQTPADFIDSKENGEWIAYSFDPQITGIDDVRITGDASDIIHIYTPTRI